MAAINIVFNQLGVLHITIVITYFISNNTFTPIDNSVIIIAHFL